MDELFIKRRHNSIRAKAAVFYNRVKLVELTLKRPSLTLICGGEIVYKIYTGRRNASPFNKKAG